MSYQRALDIAIACLDREAELAGEPLATRARVVDGLPALGLGELNRTTPAAWPCASRR